MDSVVPQVGDTLNIAAYRVVLIGKDSLQTIA